MKKIRTVSFLIVFALLLSTVSFHEIPQDFVKSVNAVSTDSIDAEDYDSDTCNHNILYNFDDETMTVNGVYEENLVADLLIDVAEYAENHYAIVLKDGVEITDGFLEQGMVVQIYHENELYREYIINELLNPNLQPPQYEEEMSSAANQHGFILPLDYMNLTSNSISSPFGWRTIDGAREFHGGIDVNKVLYNGTMTRATDLLALKPPVEIAIRAVKSGTVEISKNSSSAGNYVTINHGGGVKTVYMHMLRFPSVSVNQSVKQGDIIGYVGNTGRSYGAHLHFEIIVNSVKIDPVDGKVNNLPYNLQGAGKFVPIPSTPNARIRETYSVYSIGSSIKAGEKLLHNHYLVSPNKKYIAKMQANGDFVIYNTDTALWSDGTGGKGIGAQYVELQSDGNIVIYDSQKTPLWSLWAQAGVNNRKATTLEITDKGNLVAKDSSGGVIWTSANSEYPYETAAFNYVVNASEKNTQLPVAFNTYSKGANLRPGDKIKINECLSSQNRQFIAVLRADGNFILFNSDRVLWASYTERKDAQYVEFKSNGDIVICDSKGAVLWNLWSQPGVNNRQAAVLIMQDDGHLVAYDSNGTPIWYTGTSQQYGAGAFDIVYLDRPDIGHGKDRNLPRTTGTFSLGSQLNVGKRIEIGEYLVSPNKKYIALMQSDGNFVVYTADRHIWASGTNGKGGKHVILQGDGNIVMYDSDGKAVWNTATKDKGTVRLNMQDDGNLVAYSSSGAVWSTGTNGKWAGSAFTVTMAAYSVKYNANNGTGTMANSSHTLGAEKALTANTFTRAGYTFQGWATSATGTVVYMDKQNVKDLASNQGVIVNLYAVWKPVGNVQSVQDWVLGKSTEPVGDMNSDGVVDVFDIAALRQK